MLTSIAGRRAFRTSLAGMVVIPALVIGILVMAKAGGPKNLQTKLVANNPRLGDCTYMVPANLQSVCERMAAEKPTPDELGPSTPHLVAPNDMVTPVEVQGSSYTTPWNITTEWEELTGSPVNIGSESYPGNTLLMIFAGSLTSNPSQGVMLVMSQSFPLTPTMGSSVNIPPGDVYDPNIQVINDSSHEGALKIVGQATPRGVSATATAGSATNSSSDQLEISTGNGHSLRFDPIGRSLAQGS